MVSPSAGLASPTSAGPAVTIPAIACAAFASTTREIRFSPATSVTE